MSKAIEGAALLGGAALIGAFSLGLGGVAFEAAANSLLAIHAMEFLAVAGASMEAGAIAAALTSNRGMNITTRQPASARQIIRGQRRVGGVMVYFNTTGSKHDQYNMVIVLAGHPCDSIVNLYLDGRQVFWKVGSVGNTTRNGINFGGTCDGNDHIGPGGARYNLGQNVYCEARYGDQVQGDVIGGLTANDPLWAASTAGAPSVMGCTYVYLKIEYDPNNFASLPEIRFTVNGKNDIYDPRTATRGFTTNWALHVADGLTDPMWGCGIPTAEVWNDQLIAAANVCDEQVALAMGGTEARYCLHWNYDTGVSPGDAVDGMMSAAAGRLSRVGGQWNIFPAYWRGPSFTFDYTALTGPMQWKPYRSQKDLVNRIKGTYIAPNYPYNTAGNLYDANGYYDGSIENNFPFGFQPTDYPQYAADVLHGYASDEYLTQDGGQLLPRDISFPGVLSVAQAQRLAKITLLRNRKQGTGTLPLSLAAYAMQPMDVMSFTFPQLGMSNVALEASQMRFVVSGGGAGAEGDGEQEAPTVTLEMEVNETGADVYEWSPAEELTVYDVPASPTQIPYTPAPPANLTLTSSAGTAVVSVDGKSVQPRIAVQWDVPLDILVTLVQIQYQLVGAATWTDGPLADVASTEAFIGGVVAGQQYNVRIRSQRPNGASSVWVGASGFTVSLTLNIQGSQSLAQDALVGEAFTDGTAGIVVSPFTASIGNLNVSELPAGAFTITGLTQSQLWYVYFIDPTFAGGAITPIATQHTADFVDKVGYFLIGSLVTPYASSSGAGGGGAGTRYYPNAWADSGSRTTISAASAYDGDTTTAAIVSGSYTWRTGEAGDSAPAGGGASPAVAPGPGSAVTTWGYCTWSGFPAVTLSAAATLTVVASFQAADGIGESLDAFIGSADSSLLSTSATTGKATYTLAVAAGTNLSTLSVAAGVDGSSGSGNASTTLVAKLSIYETYVQT